MIWQKIVPYFKKTWTEWKKISLPQRITIILGVPTIIGMAVGWYSNEANRKQEWLISEANRRQEMLSQSMERLDKQIKDDIDKKLIFIDKMMTNIANVRNKVEKIGVLCLQRKKKEISENEYKAQIKRLQEERWESRWAAIRDANTTHLVLNSTVKDLFINFIKWDETHINGCLTNLLNTNTECGLIKFSNNQDMGSFERIEKLLKGKDAMILFKNELFYADVALRKIKKIEMNKSNSDDISKLKSKFTNSYQSVNDDESLTLIGRVTNNANRDGWIKTQSEIVQATTKLIKELQLDRRPDRLKSKVEKML